MKLRILYSKVSTSQDGKVVFILDTDYICVKLLLIPFSSGMLITCIATALLAFLFFTVTFCKEMFHSSIDAQHQGQAFVRDAQILQVFKCTSTNIHKLHCY